MTQRDLLHLEETREIVEAVRQIRDDRSIVETARENLGAALDRLNLTGNARLVVGPLLTAAFTVALAGPMITQTPQGYW